jgi:phosphoglycolate phosphatase-like HAD superfamily hydrolase
MPLSTDFVWEVIKKYDLPEKESKKFSIETNGMNFNDQIKMIFEKNMIPYDDVMIAKLNKEFFSLRDNSPKWQNAPLFPGVKKLLKTLHKNGVKNFISSGSNTDEITFRLKKMGILEYFDLVLGAEKIPKSQKHIDIFANFCGLSLQKFASSAFYASDGPNDMTLAQKAGIYAIGITHTVSDAKLKSAGANLTISNFEKLTKLEF